MKRSVIKLTSLMALLLVLCMPFTMTSCVNDVYGLTESSDVNKESTSGTDTQTDADGSGDIIDNIVDDTIDDGVNNGVDDTVSDGSEDPSDEDAPTAGDIVQNITNNNIIVQGGSSEGLAYATAKGLRSAVSIYCTFEISTGSSSPWNPRPSTQTYYSTGSGVIYELESDGSAFIVTNYHVVYEMNNNTENGISDSIYVYLYGMESEAYAISASYVGGSANYDLAILRVEQNEILKNAYASGSVAAVTVSDSDKAFPGATVIAIGNPSADEVGGISVTSGIISVDSEYITMTASDGSGEVSFRVIRTDAPVNSGNSGGGLYNSAGELCGIVNAKIADSDIENIGYALPSNVVRAIADNIIDYCYQTECESVMRALLGVTVQVSGSSTVYDTESALLVRVEEISIYEITAGGLGEGSFKAGDIVKSITIGDKSISVTRRHHLIDAMLDARAGDEILITVMRDGNEMTVSITVTEDCLAAY